jgi:hypothetical protein
MKIRSHYLLVKTLGVAGLMVSTGFFFACSKNNTTANAGPQLPANAIRSTTIPKGNIKGTMLSDSTYTVNGDVTILKGDTLTIQPGATINMTGNYALYVNGIVQSLGTQAKPITFTTSLTAKPGQWGGFQADSCQGFTAYWTKFLWAGGPNASSPTSQTIGISVPVPVDIEDCWFVGGQDNAIGIYSTSTVKILRNSFYANGLGDGDCIDFHSGVTGVVAYNVLWGGAGTAIKVFTNATIQNPQTNVEVYNNTCVDNGFRRGSTEPGRGIIVDTYSQARVYNNLLANNYYSLDITTTADAVNTKYNNNYFYVNVDSIRQYMYPSFDIGVAQPGDIINKTTTGANNPMFVGWNTTPDSSLRHIPSNYDFHLQSSSPALGKGYTGAVVGLPSWAPALSGDIGAYVSDTSGGKGNRHAAGF